MLEGKGMKKRGSLDYSKTGQLSAFLKMHNAT